MKMRDKQPDLTGVYFNAMELRAITLVPRSTVYRIMSKCSSRTIRYDVENRLILCVEWDDFIRTLQAQKTGNPRFRLDPAFQRENIMRRWSSKFTPGGMSHNGIDKDKHK